MQKWNIYAVYDHQAKMYGFPWIKPTHGVAERDFSQQVNDSSNPMYKSPEDYDLCHIGTYNDQDGTIEALEKPSHLVKAVQLLRN